MRKVTSEEHKEIVLDLMDAIHAYCEANGIQYFLIYGTLLGAIRHKGFIPWDDDVDIILFRNDYEKFIAGFNRECPEHMRCVNYKNTKGFYLSISRIIDKRTILVEGINSPCEMGAFVDVLALDAIPENRIKSAFFLFKLSVLRKILGLKKIKKMNRGLIKNLLWNIINICFGSIDINKLEIKINQQSMKYKDVIGCRECGALQSLVYGAREIYEKSWFDEAVLVPFEGRHYYAPAKYHKILKSVYGDYMIPPEEKDRFSYHPFDEYWAN